MVAVVSPALIITRPPPADVPDPRAMLMPPPAPLVAEPVRSTTLPLLPIWVTPVVNEIWPETPSLPASPDAMLKVPLDVARP